MGRFEELAKHLHQHQVRQVGRHQRTAELRVTQLVRPLFERPAQNARLARGFGDIDDRRQRIKQQRRMLAGKTETPADQKDLATAVMHGDTVARRLGHDLLPSLRRQRRIGRDPEAPPTVQ